MEPVARRPGSPRRILVVATAPHPQDELQRRLRRSYGEDAEVMVVAPASDLSFLQWLMNDEDRARAEAERRARTAAAAAPAPVVAAAPGDVDPLIAIEDALRSFPADEIVLVTRPARSATWLEEEALDPLVERFGRPVRHVVDDDVELDESPGERRPPPLVREIARGESPWTAFLVQHAVAVVVLGFSLVVIAIALAVYYGVG